MDLFFVREEDWFWLGRASDEFHAWEQFCEANYNPRGWHEQRWWLHECQCDYRCEVAVYFVKEASCWVDGVDPKKWDERTPDEEIAVYVEPVLHAQSMY
jgi:hypothetical protein